MTEGQDCRQCGRCCEKWGWGQKGGPEDIIPWIETGRTDILTHVGIRFRNGTRSTGRDLTAADIPRIARIDFWTDETGSTISYCPFYYRADDGKVYCRIHTTKPRVCIGFKPWNEPIKDYALNCEACRETAP